MKNHLKKLILVVFLLISSFANAETKLNRVLFQDHSNKGDITLNLSDSLNSLPNLQVNKNAITITLPETDMSKEIKSERISFATKYSLDTILDYAQSGSSSIVTLKFPFNMEKKEDQIKLKNNGKKITVTFPKVRVPETIDMKEKVPSVNAKNEKNSLDENFLDELIAKEKTKLAIKDSPKKEIVKDVMADDKVATTQAATKKEESSFSFAKYAGKFVAFLGGVLLLFYFIVSLFKKGVINRGKMGFLNNTNLVEVLSTTYVAPKKSLMLIKAHKQVFLISNTDQGISFLSEVTETSDLFKAGEKEITGTNFDEDYKSIDTENIEEKITLKKDITQSTVIAEKNKFSDQLKNKVKGLRPLS